MAETSPSRVQNIWLLDTWLAQSRYRLGGDYVAEIHTSPPVTGKEASCAILVPVVPD